MSIKSGKKEDYMANTSVMERVSTKEAAKELNIDIETLQFLLRKERIPIGYAVKKEKATRHSYYIYRGLLDSYKRQLAGKEEVK